MSASCSPARYCYSVYGVRVTSDLPFEFPAATPSSADPGAARDSGPLADVEFVQGDNRDFGSRAFACEPENGFSCEPLPDGSTYLRWWHLYEFSVSADGSRVACRPLDGCDRSVLQNFLFGQVLGVALVRQGIEPLHAAVVRVEDSAVAFLGDCTFGKSTLLATFLQAGHRMLTDDMLILDRRAGDAVAQPGAGRLKLLPDSASHFLTDLRSGTPLNPTTVKCSFPLEMSQRQRVGLPLRLLFVLPDPEDRDGAASIEIRPASRAEMVRELLKNTFTDQIRRSRTPREAVRARGTGGVQSQRLLVALPERPASSSRTAASHRRPRAAGKHPFISRDGGTLMDRLRNGDAAKSPATRKPYRRPHLVSYGHVKDVIQGGGGMMSDAAGTPPGGKSKGCWIAEVLYGVEDPRTLLLRAWLSAAYKKRNGRAGCLSRYTNDSGRRPPILNLSRVAATRMVSPPL